MHQFVRAACFIALPLAMMAPAAASAAGFTARDLAAEEGKFAAYSVKHGMRAAFLEFFADPSWLLRPELVDARKWIGARPDPAIVLDWKSQITILSTSGDLGFSTGPSLVRSKTDPAAPAEHGEFFSVWQKQNGGEWKVYVDHGISHGPTATPDALPATPLVSLDLKAAKSDAATAASNAEQRFVARGIAGYADTITPRTRLLRDGLLPIDGTAAIGEYLKSQQGQWSWTVKMQGTSRADDFAFAVGDYAWQPKEGSVRKGKYVRVWVRDATAASPQQWALAGDVLTPDPVPRN